MTQWRNPDGDAELVMWGDYECPGTREAWRSVERLLARSGDRLRFGWRHYPVPGLHPHAEQAAEAAEHAAVQGRFWELHRRLLEHQPDGLAEPKLYSHARAVGLDERALYLDLRDHHHLDRVRADKEAGKAIGPRRTPTFLVNGERWDGFYDVETLTELLG